MLLELGQRLVDAAVIAEPADVFWLRHRELRSAVDFGLAAPGPAKPGNQGIVPEQPGPRAVAITGADRPVRAAAVEERKMLWRGQLKAAAPQMLPESRLDGAGLRVDDARAVPQDQPATSSKASAPARAGSPLPPGSWDGPEDFGRMVPGDVLVARITTPAWTSLFAMASAVVTDVGGPLSHSSIVAREYGIPAVLGTGVATQRLTSGQRIRVDGDAGTVTTAQPSAT